MKPKAIKRIGRAVPHLLPHVGGHRTGSYKPAQPTPTTQPARNRGPDHVFQLEPDPYAGKTIPPHKRQRLKEVIDNQRRGGPGPNWSEFYE